LQSRRDTPSKGFSAGEQRSRHVAIGDLNGDSRADLATVNTDIPFGGRLSSVSV
jgi:hypothetical protein